MPGGSVASVARAPLHPHGRHWPSDGALAGAEAVSKAGTSAGDSAVAKAEAQNVEGVVIIWPYLVISAPICRILSGPIWWAAGSGIEERKSSGGTSLSDPI